jgi:hypothetical protein
MSIQIGGPGGAGSSFGGEARMPRSEEQVNINEVSGLLLDNDNDNDNSYNEDGQGGHDQEGKSE